MDLASHPSVSVPPLLSNQASISKYELGVIHRCGLCATSSMSAWEMVIATLAPFGKCFSA